MRICPMSEVRKCLRTVCPKEPVPPVMRRVALEKEDMVQIWTVFMKQKEGKENQSPFAGNRPRSSILARRKICLRLVLLKVFLDMILHA